jgi:hypothetical protein
LVFNFRILSFCISGFANTPIHPPLSQLDPFNLGYDPVGATPIVWLKLVAKFYSLAVL